MIKLDYVPSGIDDIKDYYGDPDPDDDMILDTDWLRANVQKFRFPVALVKSWNVAAPISLCWVHRLIGPALIDALNEIVDYKGAQYLIDSKINRWGGGFNFRFKTGSPELSTHGFGIAIDINPDIAPFGEISNQPDFIVEAFTKRGFFWGGEWPMPYKDGMHFQAATDY
jgi:hypothetical protein